jgi:HK97 family phage major capsid protein
MSMSKLQRIKDEIQSVWDTADREGRDATPGERVKVQRLLQEAESESLKARVKALDGGGFVDRSGPGGLDMGFTKGPGDRFVASEGWKAIADPQHRPQQWSTGPIEVAAYAAAYGTKGTLLEGAGAPGSGSGGGLIPSPHVESGIVTTLFQQLSVVDMIPKSQASTTVVRYSLEGTATSGAAGVAERGLKPESTLGLSVVDEQVRKIATTITLSDEMLEDGDQIQTYLNSRLSLFVSIEQERQVLRGTGAGANKLLGFFGRSINTYNIGADQPAVGIYKALVNTRGSANLAPTGIVMHPVNYANIRRGTATTGEYLAGYPIGSGSGSPGIYQDNLWGLPVALSNNVGLGTALIGAFDSACRLYNRGGVTVEVSNQHASYFANNLVMVRAESRAALAVFRPTAFTAVTGLGVAI